MTFYRKLILTAFLLAFCVIVLGAYVRLSDAGLGCPDWPGCYGKLTPHHASAEIDAALRDNPHGVVSHAKAWKEMVHRYLAGTLGLLVMAILGLTLWQRAEVRGGIGLPAALAALIVFQALLGMWTVTERLKPVVVSAHLLGGMATLALLTWLWLREARPAQPVYYARAEHLRGPAAIGLALVAVQIALGGWVSSNYAALACPDFPTCQGQWWPATDFAQAFSVRRELGYTASGELLPIAALTAIHWTHRLMALVVAVFLGVLAARLAGVAGFRGSASILGGLLALQILLGIGNVVFGLPLALAVLHNAGAALLLVAMVMLNFRLRRN